MRVVMVGVRVVVVAGVMTGIYDGIADTDFNGRVVVVACW